MNSSLIISRRRFLHNTALITAGLGFSSLTLNREIRTIRFGLVTDSHYADRDPHNTRFYRQSLEKMEEFVQVMNREKVDFVMHLGDFKDEDPKQNEEDTLGYLTALETVYARFKGPRYHCIGNHDIDSINKSQFLAHITNTDISKTSNYYSFNHGHFHFVVLDANYHQDGRDHFYKEGADWQDTNILESQLDWLTEDLNQTSSPTVIFCHHPLYEYFRDDYKFHVNQYSAVQKILTASKKTVAVFQGHVHDEQYRTIDGINYCTQFGMVDYSGLENNSFAIVELDGKGINVLGYKRVSDRKLTT